MTPVNTGLTEDLSGDSYVLALLANGLSQTEQVPETAMEQAYAACLMATVDAELVELISASSTGDSSSVGCQKVVGGEVGPGVTGEPRIRIAGHLVNRWVTRMAHLVVGVGRSWVSKRERSVTRGSFAAMELSTDLYQLHPAGYQLVALR